MLRKLYDWVLAKAAHPHAEGWLAAFSFIEASFFPILHDGRPAVEWWVVEPWNEGQRFDGDVRTRAPLPRTGAGLACGGGAGGCAGS